MEHVSVLVDKANKSFQTADHLAYVTYPLLKETKLVLTILENLFNAFAYGVDAFLAYEAMYKRIPYNLPADFKSRFDIFRSDVVLRYKIGTDEVTLISELKSILDHRRKSPMEFVRNDKIVICSDDYKLRTLNYDKAKAYINKSKPFFTRLNSLLKENDRRR